MLLENLGGIMAWSLGLSEKCISSIRNGANDITLHMESLFDDDHIDVACIAFFQEKIRIAKGQKVFAAHNLPPKPGTLQYLFEEYLNKREPRGWNEV